MRNVHDGEDCCGQLGLPLNFASSSFRLSFDLFSSSSSVLIDAWFVCNRLCLFFIFLIVADFSLNFLFSTITWSTAVIFDA